MRGQTLAGEPPGRIPPVQDLVNSEEFAGIAQRKLDSLAYAEIAGGDRSAFERIARGHQRADLFCRIEIEKPLHDPVAGAWILVFIPATRELSAAIFLVVLGLNLMLQGRPDYLRGDYGGPPASLPSAIPPRCRKAPMPWRSHAGPG